MATLSEEMQHVLSTLCPSAPPGSTTDDAGAPPTVPEASPSAPPMTFLRAITLLDSIPGVNQQGAELLVAEWGIDMERFGTAPRLAAWSGIAPGNNESAGIQRSGKTRKGNRALRTGLVQMAHAAAHTKDTYLSALYHRLTARRGKKRAIIAVAHSIVRSAFHMLLRREPYPESDTPRRAGGLMSRAASKAAGCHLPTQTASNRPSSSLVFWSRIDALTCSSAKPTVETA